MSCSASERSDLPRFLTRAGRALARRGERSAEAPGAERAWTSASDGELSKISYATYIKDRITGFDGESSRKPGPRPSSRLSAHPEEACRLRLDGEVQAAALPPGPSR